MAQQQTNAPERGGAGQLAIIAGALLIVVSGLYFLWPGAAPYHPEIHDSPETATRSGVSLLD